MARKASLRPWLLTQAFPKIGEMPSLRDGEHFSPVGASYLYLYRPSSTAFLQHVCQKSGLPGWLTES